MDNTFEAGQSLDTLLDRITAGEEIIVTRNGQPIAKMVPADNIGSKLKALKAAEAILEASKSARLEGLSLRTLIDEGRR